MISKPFHTANATASLAFLESIEQIDIGAILLEKPKNNVFFLIGNVSECSKGISLIMNYF